MDLVVKEKRICIINGTPENCITGLNQYIKDLTNGLNEYRHSVKLFNLSELNIKHCTGCWSCWVKTPGLCAQDDDSDIIRKEYINSDLVIMATPVLVGHVSGLLKRQIDKLIPLAHPYITLINGETTHEKRYQKVPAICGIIARSKDTDDTDAAIVKEYLKRMTIQFQSDFAFCEENSVPLSEMINKVNQIGRA